MLHEDSLGIAIRCCKGLAASTAEGPSPPCFPLPLSPTISLMYVLYIDIFLYTKFCRLAMGCQKLFAPHGEV